MSGNRVLVVGDVFLDVFIELTGPPAPPAGDGDWNGHQGARGLVWMPARTHARWHRSALGGSAARTAQALAAFGCRVKLLACVGDDSLADALTSGLAGAGVDTTALVRIENTASGITTVMTTAQGGRAVTVARGANDALAASHLPDVRDFDWIHLSGYLLRTASGRELARLLAARTRADGIPLSLDPGAPSGAAIAATATELLPALAWLTPNSTEATWLSGRDDALEAARELRAAGAARVAVTCGASGAVVADTSGTTRIAAPAVVPGEATGAGDAFDGGLIAATLGGLDPLAAAFIACACGAHVVAGQRPGPGTVVEELIGQISTHHHPARERAQAWLRTLRA